MGEFEREDGRREAPGTRFAGLHDYSSTRSDVFVLPRTLAALDAAWDMFQLRPESAIRRARCQQHMEGNGADTRMVWTGNRDADRVMKYGVVLPANHGVNDDDVDHIWATASSFLAQEGLRA